MSVSMMRVVLIAAAVAAGRSAAADAGMAEGPYECWFFNQPRMGLNFTVTGATAYTSDAEGTPGAYALSGKDVTWVSGYMKGAMPEDFTTIYEVRHGKPTVAFMSGRGSEAAFCEKAS